MTRVKICGITNPEDARQACDLGADAIGLNFYPESVRCISPFMARTISRVLPPYVASIGVFVDWTPQVVVTLAGALGLTGAQLHGDEAPEDVATVAEEIRVIKAIRAERGVKVEQLSAYKAASAILIDAAVPGEYGGTGVQANWEFAQAAAKSKSIVLSGGLTAENVGEAIRMVRPYAVDVASGVECKPGKKDLGKLKEFFAEVARADASAAS